MSQEAQNVQAAAPEPAPAAAPSPMFRWFDSAGVDDLHTTMSAFLRRCEAQAADRTPRERLADVLAAAYSTDDRRILVRQMGASPEEVVPGAKIAAEEAWTIIEYFERRSRFGYLLAQVRRDRPGAFLPSVEDALTALLAGVDPRFVSTLPTIGAPADRLLVTLHRLNRVERLDDGTVPFVVWLRAAMQLIGPIPEAAMFQRALAALQQPRAGSAPASLLVPPASRPMARAVLRFDLPLSAFTEREQRTMVHTLAGLLGISVEEIRVEKIEAGSVKVTISLPEEAAARLSLDAVATALAALKSKSIRVRPLCPALLALGEDPARTHDRVREIARAVLCDRILDRSYDSALVLALALTRDRALDVDRDRILDSTHRSALALAVARAIVIVLDLEGDRYPLLGAMTVLGRDTDCAIVVEDVNASRRHSEIRVTVDGPRLVATVKDLGSTNGTWVNGERVTSQRLTNGDRLTVGRTSFVYRSGRR